MRKTEYKYLGTIFTNKYNTQFKIIEYINYNNVTVLDMTHNIILKNIMMKDIKLNYIISPLDKSVFDVGYYGIGEYTRDNHSKCYQSWYNMMFRCYSDKYRQLFPTYKDIYVCDEWKNYQNFAKWFYSNYYEINNERMELDKDILIKHNKIYAPNTCCFLPRRINSLLINSKAIRGKFPIGVDYNNNKYRARCNTLNGSVHLGYFTTVEKAFIAYKNFKEQYIKDVANEYKEYIPKNVYDALMKYTIEMND